MVTGQILVFFPLKCISVFLFLLSFSVAGPDFLSREDFDLLLVFFVRTVLGNFGLPLGSHQVHTVFRVKASVSSAQIWRSPRFTRLQRCSRFGSRSERSVPTRFSRSLFLFSVAQAPV
jgi:hypothetical protein